MQVTLRKPQVALNAGEVLTLDDAAGTRIQARVGQIWITEEGSTKDHVLGPGEAFTVARDGRTVVQAIHSAWILLAEAQPAANDVA